MRASLNNQIRRSLQNDLSSLHRTESILTDKIHELRALIAKIDRHLSSFEHNRAQFHSIYNPRSEWNGTERRHFDDHMNSEILDDYRSFLTSVRRLREDVQDEARRLNNHLYLCRSDIRSVHSSLSALND
ncbi:DUF5082 family protein [Sporolactobacillus sp. Y61]|uniref:DUF5082 family protein n=1 Tax=Sporolactobacillus sp. Y61 TaxID=3160863 RepID=A0AAU8IHG8_9BACL